MPVARRCTLALVLLLASSAAAGDGPNEAYQSARKGYYALKADAQRRKLRHNWQNVAKKFDAVAQRYPKSDRAPEALYTAGQLFEDLSQISRVAEDLDAAVGDYKKLLEVYPAHRLCDDAALALGRIQADRLGNVHEARRVLEASLEKYPRGDRARETKALLASLPAEDDRQPAPRRIAPKGEKAAEPIAPAPSAVVAAIQKLELKPAPEETKPAPPVADEKMAKERLKTVGRRDEEVTLAEQLGLKIRRVVIDAGHGGHDTGAIGPGGTREKDVSLALAHRVGDLLAESGLEVLLTRDDDTFVRLEDRARIANEAKGDLFISIHCNSAQTGTYRGVETYTLNTSSDRYSIRLAARENSSSEKGVSDLQFILADLATKANTDESQRLATRVQRSLVGSLRAKYTGIHDLGTKEALFYVLLGAKMPAILVETSFLSNSEEEKRLASHGYQEDVAQAIAQGVQDFLSRRERLAKID
jgi:N-acetylmuramoyl-L-alanine amidase